MSYVQQVIYTQVEWIMGLVNHASGRVFSVWVFDDKALSCLIHLHFWYSNCSLIIKLYAGCTLLLEILILNLHVFFTTLTVHDTMQVANFCAVANTLVDQNEKFWIHTMYQFDMTVHKVVHHILWAERYVFHILYHTDMIDSYALQGTGQSLLAIWPKPSLYLSWLTFQVSSICRMLGQQSSALYFNVLF